MDGNFLRWFTVIDSKYQIFFPQWKYEKGEIDNLKPQQASYYYTINNWENKLKVLNDFVSFTKLVSVRNRLLLIFLVSFGGWK